MGALIKTVAVVPQIAGDGDCGITARRGAEAILGAQVPYNNPKAALEAMAEHVGNSMGGDSCFASSFMRMRVRAANHIETACFALVGCVSYPETPTNTICSLHSDCALTMYSPCLDFVLLDCILTVY